MLKAGTAVFRGVLRTVNLPHLGRPLQAPALSTTVAGRGDTGFHLTTATMNPRILELEYAVRGKIVIEAMKIENAMNRVRSFRGVRGVVQCHALFRQLFGRKRTCQHPYPTVSWFLFLCVP